MDGRGILFSKPFLCLFLRLLSFVFELSMNAHLSDSNSDNRELRHEISFIEKDTETYLHVVNKEHF